MSQRYVVETSLDGVHRIWDFKKEETVMMRSALITTIQDVADKLNNNLCAICDEQCEEAHSNTRYGRVCEKCSDTYVGESGDIDWTKVVNDGKG